MRHRFFIGLAAPLVLLFGLAPALAQQTVPPPSPEGSGSREADETRELEREIEAYPGPNDGVKEETGASDVGSRIPEKINPAPRKPAVTPRAHGAASEPAAGATTAPRQAGATSIDPSEVQRVFGSDVDIIALSSLEPAQVTRLQLRLRELGHYLGSVDGVAGPQTRAALQAYARAQFALKQRLLQHDQLTTDLAEQLGVQQGPPRGAAPAFRDEPALPATPNRRGDAPLVPPGAVPMTPPGVTPLPPPSGGPPLPTPSSDPKPAASPPARPSP
jgi:hypothetical protein